MGYSRLRGLEIYESAATALPALGTDLEPGEPTSAGAAQRVYAEALDVFSEHTSARAIGPDPDEEQVSLDEISLFDLLKSFRKVLDRYDAAESSLLAIMQDVQAEERYLPREAMNRIAERLELTELTARAHFIRGNLCFPRGDFEGCLREHSRALELAREDLETSVPGPAVGLARDTLERNGWRDGQRIALEAGA